MRRDGKIRGRLLASLGVDADGGHAIEATFPARRDEVGDRDEVDHVKLAALVRLAEEPTLWCAGPRRLSVVGPGPGWQTSPGRLRRPPPARRALAVTDHGPGARASGGRR